MQQIVGMCEECTGNVVEDEDGLFYCYCEDVGLLVWQAGKWERLEVIA